MDSMLLKIINKFKIVGEVKSIIPWGSGHINRTYRVDTDKEKYILQRINDFVFKDIDSLMKNIVLVTEATKKRLISEGKDPLRKTLTVIKTLNNEDYYQDETGFYRVYIFLDKTLSFDLVTDSFVYREVAISFANFMKNTASLDPNSLSETIKDFHNTPKRFERLLEVIRDDKVGRKKLCEAEINFALSHEYIKDIIAKPLSTGEIPLRITHNDTKVNNVLLDEKTKTGVSVIDLDTVMSGSFLYDFGDSIRSGCNTGLEDEEDLNKVNFNLDLYKVYKEGTLSVLNGIINEKEKELMPLAGPVMTYECGIRFLTDFLEGDVYFKTKDDMHNLRRCRTQFKLVKEMLEKQNEMSK